MLPIVSNVALNKHRRKIMERYTSVELLSKLNASPPCVVSVVEPESSSRKRPSLRPAAPLIE